eukprot:2533544-Pyramimonas_sp.AAC.1
MIPGKYEVQSSGQTINCLTRQAACTNVRMYGIRLYGGRGLVVVVVVEAVVVVDVLVFGTVVVV